jgi:hypothetical protein
MDAAQNRTRQKTNGTRRLHGNLTFWSECVTPGIAVRLAFSIILYK